MHDDRTGQIAVIFVSQLSGLDADGYTRAAAAMDALAARQPGYRGVVACRGGEGAGITVSYWADQAAAIAWRDYPDHAAIRDRGRGVWYDRYDMEIAMIERSYGWQR